jgi:hypothetical protein
VVVLDRQNGMMPVPNSHWEQCTTFPLRHLDRDDRLAYFSHVVHFKTSPHQGSRRDPPHAQSVSNQRRHGSRRTR